MAHLIKQTNIENEWEGDVHCAPNIENFKRFNNWSSVNYQFENVWYDIRLYGLMLLFSLLFFLLLPSPLTIAPFTLCKYRRSHIIISLFN